MFRSLYFKIVLIFLACIITVICTITVIIMISVTSFYADSFSESMNQNLSDDASLYKELKNAMGDGVFAEEQKNILDSYGSILGINANRNYYILNMDGEVIVSSDTEAKETLTVTANIVTAMSKERGDYTGGSNGFVDYAVYLSAGDDECLVYFKDSLNEMQRLNSELFAITLQSVFWGVLIALILSLFLAKAITYPLQSLTQGAQLIAAGEFSHDIDVNSNDEIGILTDNFNIMKDVLYNTIEQVDGERRKLETVFACMRDGIFVFTDTGALLNCNESAIKILAGEYSSSKITMEDLFEIFEIPLKREEGGIAFTDQNVRHERMSDGTYIFSERTHKDSVYDISVGSVMYVSDNANHMGLAVVLHDVSARYELDRSRQEFVANVSHELRTPLTAIKGACETVLEDSEMPLDMREYFINMAVNECDRMIRIVSDLLMLSRLDGQRMRWNIEQFDIKTSLSDICDMMRGDIESHGHKLSFNAVKGPLVLSGDKSRIEQVLINILSNAVKYTPDGGEIDIRACNSGDNVIVEISDNGVGIPEEDVSHLFERFYRVEKARTSDTGGTGLGLSIAREIIESHNGKISVESTFGEGTTVRISLPVKCGINA